MPPRATCLARWLELVGDALTQPAGERFPHQDVAQLLQTSFEAACCSLHVVSGTWVDSVEGCWPAGYLPPIASLERPPDATWHPLMRWYAHTASTGPQVLGAVPAAIADRSLMEGWTAFARPFGITHQLALPLVAGDGVQTYLLSRPDDDFGDDDADLAALVQPVLAALFRQHQLLAQRAASQLTSAAGTGLTGRETAVLQLLAAGLTAGSIAHRLGCSPRTVHKHLERLYRKLDVSDRMAAVQEARRLGLV
ncbi:response regulator transcription factor [Geodermatophilus sp. URMC 61]|uniref:response regulator transcription factor n=1 Tax=Geodermatophilus sp. URMC 61 TaxID=3423411 RepID=UPI00406C64AC